MKGAAAARRRAARAKQKWTEKMMLQQQQNAWIAHGGSLHGEHGHDKKHGIAYEQ